MTDDKKNPFADLAAQIREKQKMKSPLRSPQPATRVPVPAPPRPGSAPLPTRQPPPRAAQPVRPQARPSPPPPPPPPVEDFEAPEEEASSAPPPPEKAPQATLTPDQILAMAKMGYTQWEYGKLERARTIFQTLVNNRPNEPWFRCALGSVYQRQRQYAQAIQQYNIALQLDPNDIPSRVNRGEILIRVGKKQEGAADLQYAMKADRSGKHPSALRAKSLLTALTQGARARPR